MNTTDLEQELSRQAQDIPDLAAVQADASARFAVRTRRRSTRSLIAVAAAVVLVAGGAAIATSMLPTGSETASLVPGDLVPALTAEQQSFDQMPPDLGIIDQAQLDPQSSRLLGESNQGKQWVALNDDGDICLVLAIPGHVGGTSCATPEIFYQHGAFLTVSGGEPSHGAVAYLLPSDIDATSVSAAVDRVRGDTGWVESYSRDSSPLIVFSPATASAVGTITVHRDNGEKLVLHLP